MFVLFDSSRTLWPRLVRSSSSNRTNVDVQPDPFPNARYPLFGLDLPKLCAPSRFDQVLLGELPPVSNLAKYEGQRFFIKPGRFGFVQEILQRAKCRVFERKNRLDCAKLRAFKQNADKRLLKLWKKLLAKLPSKWRLAAQYRQRAIKYGLGEIFQQATDLEAAGAGKRVRDFRKLLTKIYGSDDVVVRKGREIIFTLDDLKGRPPTCSPTLNLKKCK